MDIMMEMLESNFYVLGMNVGGVISKSVGYYNGNVRK